MLAWGALLQRGLLRGWRGHRQGRCGYAKNWLQISYGFAVGFNRCEVNELKPKYEVESRAVVAAKRYRYKDCGSYENAN
jgi:hypothetical protein